MLFVACDSILGFFIDLDLVIGGKDNFLNETELWEQMLPSYIEGHIFYLWNNRDLKIMLLYMLISNLWLKPYLVVTEE